MYGNPNEKARGRVYPHRDLTGLKFGRWTVLRLLGKKYNAGGESHLRWLCRCDCGTERDVDGNYVANGHSQSCGCLKKERQREVVRKPDGHSARNCLFTGYVCNAKARGLSWEISKEEFYSIVSLLCHYCGIPFSMTEVSRSNTGDFIHNGVDRIDSDIGYKITNVVPCCSFCNYAKRDHSYVDFMAWIERLIQFRNHK